MDRLPSARKIFSYLPYFLILLGSIIAFLPFLLENTWFKSHDGIRYILIFNEFKESFLHGQIYPRWQANMYGGYGYPSFTFYQPGYFYLLLIISFFIKGIIPLFFTSFVILFSLSGSGAYKLCRHFCDSFSSLCFAILYLCTPYIYVNLFVRGDLSELAAMLISPWPFYFLLSLKKSLNNEHPEKIVLNTLLLSLSLFAVIMTHPATALFLCPVIFILSITLCLDNNRFDLKLLKTALIGFILSVLLSSPYWITLFQLKSYASFGNIGQYFTSPSDHIVYWKQFISNAWHYTYSNPGPQDGMPFQLGFMHLSLSVFGFFLARRNKFIAVSFACYVVLIFLMSPLSIWIWKHAPIIPYIQFPWRILCVTAVLQLICFCGLGIVRENKSLAFKFVLLVILTFTVIFYHKQFIFIYDRNNVENVLNDYMHRRLVGFTGLNSENEFLPKFANLKGLKRARGNYPMAMMIPPEKMLPLPDNNPYHIHFSFSNNQRTHILINQFYFPGWVIKINGKSVSKNVIERNLSPGGLMVVVVESGDNQILEAYYDGPPYRRIRTIAVILLSSLLIMLLFKEFPLNSRRVA